MRNALLRLLLVLSFGTVLSACQSTPQRQATTSERPGLTTSGVPPTATAGLAASAPEPPAPVQETPAASVVPDTYQVINTYPHDREAFTQGLAYSDGTLYEGTGLYGQSSLRAVDLTSGTVLKQRSLAADMFGEGIAVIEDRILQLTWQSKTGFVYERASFAPTLQWTYPTEGWGLTYDGAALIMSDGTATLRFLDPVTFREIRRIEVVDASGPVTRLNELEYVNGQNLGECLADRPHRTHRSDHR